MIKMTCIKRMLVKNKNNKARSKDNQIFKCKIKKKKKIEKVTSIKLV